VDAESDIGALDIAAHGDRWLVVWTREAPTERDATLPYAAWLPGGAPFPLLAGRDRVDVEDVRFTMGVGPNGGPCVALVTLGEECVVVEVGDTEARVVGRIGA
jgi:hypothetical protein